MSQSSAKILWQPSSEQIAKANITTFKKLAEEKFNLKFSDYNALHAWSINCAADFWSLLADFTKLKFSKPAHTVVDDPLRLPGAKWFLGAELNFAENCLEHESLFDKTALISYDEAGKVCELSFGQLREQVLQLAAAMKADGISKGDFVVGVLSNNHEAVIAFLACAAIGAVWSSCSPEFGTEAILKRFAQLDPKLIFFSKNYQYNGKVFDTTEKINLVISGISSIRRAVIFCDELGLLQRNSMLVKASNYSAKHSALNHYEQLSFSDPLYVLFSSGTTGLPKGIIHSVGGSLLQHLKEQQLHCNLTSNDRLFYYTTCSWMMWNWLVSALASGASIVLYSGAVFFPDVERLLRLVATEKISIFGTSASYLSALQAAGYKDNNQQDLSALQTILSTGSPLSTQSFNFVYDEIKRAVMLCSISGGTDIVSCFVLGNPTMPVYEGEIQVKGLGMAVQVYDDSGKAVINQKGELVCTQAAPSMPTGFVADPQGEKYRSAYFERFLNVWAHGDYALENERGSFVIYGRSDTVLNPGGVRIGTAEIYAVVQEFLEVVDYAATAFEKQNDTVVILFLKLQEGITLNDSLMQRVKLALREKASPRHVPKAVFQVTEIPKTPSGKTSEIAIREVINSRLVRNLSALANPECLEEYKHISRLLTAK